MGRKNERERQKRRQRKQNTRAAKRKRSASRSGGQATGAPPAFSRGALATMACVDACQALLGGAGCFDAEERQDVRRAARDAGGIWPRLPFELEAFLYEDASWSLTCADLEPVRRSFAQHEAWEAFDRLWVLALTNAPDGGAAFDAAEDEDCAHRAALAFQALRTSLDDPERDPGEALSAVVEEMDRHGARATLKKSYEKLLASAVASVRAPPRTRSGAVGKLAGRSAKLFEREAHKQSATAWWQCGRVFLAEVFERHGNDGCGDALAEDPGFLTELLDAPHALVWMARHLDAPERLRSVPFHSAADGWLRLLRRRIDPRTLTFEDRLRYEIARIKLLDALACASEDHGPLLAAFAELRALLAHGVPPAHRALPDILESPLVDFYVGAVAELQCEDAALPTTEELLERHPQDFRLACLYATAALRCGERRKLRVLAQCPPRSQVDAELFARCARTWSQLPQGTRAAASVRPLLFDCLDREDRKRCLLALARQALWRARGMDTYRQELHRVLPYFERDNFVYRALEDKTALESALVFFATMMAPLHDVRLSLDEMQSQQWVSYAREIAQQSALGARLATHHLKTPSRWLTLAPSVASAAGARLDEFRPSARRSREPERRTGSTGSNRAGRRRRRSATRAAADSSTQPGLFDAHDP